ncbi:MAG: DUF3108 domain-containing protein, partial [bacterium]
MRKRVSIVSGLFFLLFINIFTGTLAAEEVSDKANRKITNEAFRVGEKLTFAIRWGLITAGYATMEVRGITDGGNGRVYEIVSEAKTSSFFDVFYTVRDTVKSYIDAD